MRLRPQCGIAQKTNKMKILTGAQIKQLDQYTIEHEPITSLDLMERSARAIVHAVVELRSTASPIVIFAGPGNNGGDALAVARLLADKGYKVDAYLFNVRGHLSSDCETNKKRLEESKRINRFTEVTRDFDPPVLTAQTLVIDGLFGSGLNKPLEGGFAVLTRYLNQSEATIVSIDMPSGLMTEDNTANNREAIVRADVTLTLHAKKLAMLMADVQEFVGRVQVLDIHLSTEGLDNMEAQFTTIELADVATHLPHRNAFAHKGQMGHALIVAGSYGMAGASILATRACLRSGAGKVTVVTPANNVAIMQTAVPEAVLWIDSDEQCYSTAVETEGLNALGIGPGLGLDETTALALITQVRTTKCPIVIDADAINILCMHDAWMHQLPNGLIFTPHVGEFDRLAGRSESDYERLMKAHDMAERLNAYILLKGHHSALCSPDGSIVFNTTGNAGMATAGSGDVLTGIITALLARGCDRKWACLAGMYLHGLAGDMAAQDKGEESMVASDIVAHLPQAFKRLKDRQS